ncbi:stage II sporulation protein P [Cohnella cholangitidis]|uniref:SH3 domain-containing protein n=1 Tax=Cohnella cholangitidis TaxID=2598458 RepID=A0A7G5BX02_9BACL|nr:stage II sporulation protein P [Cohnella cholangitidis]QMV41486.1 SH3 domain-containing protein [Cohnella cholangitidis]
MFLRKSILIGCATALLLFVALDPAYGSPSSPSESSNQNISVENEQAERKTSVVPEAVVNIVDVTNLRSGPGLDYEIVGKAMPGDTFPVVGLEGDWHQVELSSGDTAYVAAWVVKIDKPIRFVNIVEVTNLRNGPGLDYKIVGKARLGDSFQIVGTEGDWYQVSLPGGDTAYVAGWVVKTGLGDQVSQPKVYIYHTHNRESWKNVVGNKKGTSFDDPKVNITLVGQQMGEVLRKKGIQSLVSKDDYTEKLKQQNLGFSFSYAESRKDVKKAMEANPSLAYFFDIHRDADVPRKSTTATIKGKSYARILFVIGTAHPNFAANKKLAEALNARLNKKYPGLSRGVLAKSAHQGNGEYNQSISPGSLLMEFGGVNNTLEENLLTAEAFADVFAEYYGSLK